MRVEVDENSIDKKSMSNRWIDLFTADSRIESNTIVPIGSYRIELVDINTNFDCDVVGPRSYFIYLIIYFLKNFNFS